MVKRYVKELVRKKSPTLYSWLKTGNDKFFLNGKQKILLSLKNNAAGVFTEEMLAPFVSTEWGRRASWGMLGLLVILVLSTLVQMFTGWYEDSGITRSHINTVNQHQDDQQVFQLVAQLPEEHLFGKVGVDDGEAVPITSLQLRLVGVVKSDQEGSSRVIISEAGHPGVVYNVGDSLPSGITVNAITNDGVILENNGHMEKLPLQRPQLSFQGMPKSLLDQGNET